MDRFILKTLVLCISAGMLGGCANQYFRVSPVLMHEPVDPSAKGERDSYKKPIDLAFGPGKDLYDAAKNDPTNISRNILQNKIIELSDDVCEQHKGDIMGTAATTNLTTGLGATVFSGVSAIVTGAAATNYAAGATILNGTRSAINAEVYQGLFTSAIIKAIEESRDKKKSEILGKQLKKPVEYSVDQAIIDAQDYHFRCSFYHGLVVLNEDSKKRATPSRDDLFGRIEVLRNEIEKNSRQTNIATEQKDATNKKIQQGINDLYDQLNSMGK